MSSEENQHLLSIRGDERYQGKWIAILDRDVIAVGNDITSVYNEAMTKSPRTL